MSYICTKFHGNNFNDLKNQLGWSQFTKGQKTEKTVEGVVVVVLCSLPDNAVYNCALYYENISKGFRVIEQT